MSQPGGSIVKWIVIAAFACLAPVALWPKGNAAQPEYFAEDARLHGQQIKVFTDEQGQTVVVLLGDFSLQVGDRMIGGRDAVVWVRDTQPNTLRHEITAYVEGNACVTEPGAVTTDDVMLVKAFQDGRLSITGNVSSQPLECFPLYERAKAARTAEWGRTQRSPRHAAPPLIVARQRQTRQALPATEVAAGVATSRPAASEPVQEEAPRELKPVSFSYDSVASYLMPDKQRITVLRGNVYFSQGSADSDLFLEMTCDSAVLFSQPIDPNANKHQSLLSRATGSKKADKAPSSSDESPEYAKAGEMVEVGSDVGLPENIAGVYLEGDVVISRGERYLRAERAFYDFTQDTALVLDPVFRTVQEQRNIPLYVRASEARVLSDREVYFENAKVSTSDFYNPGYHIGAKRVYVKDTTPYDDEGQALGPRSMLVQESHTTVNLQGVPIFYWPYQQSNLEDGHTALRRAGIGGNGDFGSGVETEWHLFRLLGLLEPKGYKATLSLDWYQKGLLGGVDLEYARIEADRQYSGYSKFYGVIDNEGEDDFGEERKNIPAPTDRGRVLVRHKELLPAEVELQLELSYLSDKNFLEEFFRDEFWAGKEQDTLIYAKKQKDNWALTALLQARIDDFLTQTESAPDLGANLIGQSLWGDRLTGFSNNQAGIKRFMAGDDSPLPTSDYFARLDTRNEVDAPLHAGPMNVVPYAVVRGTYWGEGVEGPHTENILSSTGTITGTRSVIGTRNDVCRPYAQTGVRANTHIWRVYDGAHSRLWDVNRLKHVITPEVATFVSDTGGVEPDELFPMNHGTEQDTSQFGAFTAGVLQRLQTKRGVGENLHNVDWMRLNVLAAFFDREESGQPPFDGRWFWYRPENSVPRDHVLVDYAWNISDATAFLADANYDLEDGDIGTASAALAISRDPRVRYYLGWRYIRYVDSSVGTAGFNYQINKKYSLSIFEQYDFDVDNGKNLATSVSLTRKFARWYASFTFVFDQTQGNAGVFLTIWPEGAPEMRIGSSRVGLLGQSSDN